MIRCDTCHLDYFMAQTKRPRLTHTFSTLNNDECLILEGLVHRLVKGLCFTRHFHHSPQGKTRLTFSILASFGL